ncbi:MULTISPECIES: nitrate- and nitrite sensing domain-containing protein [unclassified Crossiella]|uniref:sensor histidine kinase n=1 Tax=unclassified Crossiella TaxID=2620835 RepID=UPI001FFF81EE|nr:MULTISPECIES: nitrate- and nitrite sensing domain-containing protein [unclassified Crossiella]MCK2241461.1 nitrate- and nitrite sensing domain-containing protein [Crossiella sp. S99.2]MCK2255667.1 nitrate- and nitrite sensing domain-containing protein [Crossiella sp. S99.1]
MSEHEKPKSPNGRSLSPRNWPLRSKLAVVLLVPALSTVTLAGLRLSSQLGDVDLFAKVQQELQIAGKVVATGTALQRERDAAVSYVASGRAAGGPEHSNRISAVDLQVGELRALGAAATGIGGGVRGSFEVALESLDKLGALRRTVQGTKYPVGATITGYTQIMDSLTQVQRAATAGVNDPVLTPLATAAKALADAKEQLAVQNAILQAAARAEEFPPGQVTALRSARSRFDAALAEFESTASLADRQRYLDTVSGPPVDGLNRLVQLALVQADAGQPVTIDDVEVLRDGDRTVALVAEVLTNIQQQAEKSVVTVIADARAAVYRDSALVGLALLAAFALMIMVARWMLVPLRALRGAALDIARVRLPAVISRIRAEKDPRASAETAVAPVPVHTTDEVGQVARAFDVVHKEAVRLAVAEMALRANVNEMFTNLSRRSQEMVERQIDLIDRLEQEELDPDHLARLFELDHLATRMRRNSENLLVLSGTSPERWVTRPVPVFEVIGAALSEVEAYARVEVLPVPETLIQGRVVTDLTHLVAELLDNATEFSPPTTKVSVRAVQTRSGKLVIKIRDRGIGMSQEDLVRFNERLAAPPEVDVSVTRAMGLFVVGELAKRHSITVQLKDDEFEGGTTALVILPPALLHKADAPIPPDPLQRSGTDANPLPRPRVRIGRGDTTVRAGTPHRELTLSEWFSASCGTEEPQVPALPAPQRPVRPETPAVSVTSSWVSPADDGWQAAAALSAPVEHNATEAGLPKRVPKSLLVPGSPQRRHALVEQPAPRPGSGPNAEHLRDRFSAYQQGVRHGRESADDHTPPPGTFGGGLTDNGHHTSGIPSQPGGPRVPAEDPLADDRILANKERQ